MELRQLKYFMALSETGNFARAAEMEHITQSALSQQVARLERQLGVVLFERTPRGSRLTKAGEEILVLARTVLAEVSRLESYARSLGRGLEGALRIGSPMYAVTNPARRAIERLFAKRLPGVELLFENEWSMTLARRLRAGELDLTFTMIGEPVAGLEKLMIDESPAFLVMRQDDDLAALEQVDRTNLAGSRVLIYPRTLSPWIFERLATPLALAGADVLELREPTLPAALDQVREGAGLFLAVPWEVHLMHATHMEGLVVKPTSGGPGLQYALWLARRDSDQSPLAQAFWDVAREIAVTRATSQSPPIAGRPQ